MAIIQSPTNSDGLFFSSCGISIVVVGVFFSLLYCSWNCFPGKLGKSNSWRDVTSWTLSLVSHTHKQPRWRSDTHSSIPFFFPLAHTQTHNCKDLSSTACQVQQHTELSKQAGSCNFSHWLLPSNAGDAWSNHVRHFGLVKATAKSR